MSESSAFQAAVIAFFAAVCSIFGAKVGNIFEMTKIFGGNLVVNGKKSRKTRGVGMR